MGTQFREKTLIIINHHHRIPIAIGTAFPLFQLSGLPIAYWPFRRKFTNLLLSIAYCLFPIGPLPNPFLCLRNCKSIFHMKVANSCSAQLTQVATYA